MSKNYIKPYDDNYEDTPEDYLYLAMTFSQALNEVLDKGVGVVIEVRGDALNIHDAKKVVVFNDGEMIRVVAAGEKSDLQHGNWVQMIRKDNVSN